MLNYHELTMNESRDSPARRKQFLVITFIMTALFLNSALNAGVLSSLEITEGTFPGGEFVYKFMVKDYAASFGTLRTIAEDLGIGEKGLEVPDDPVDLLYSVLFDDEKKVPGGRTRFAGGAILQPSQKHMKQHLIDMNQFISKGGGDDGGGTHSKEVRYEVGKLPKVKAVVAQHPFSNGAFSALLQSFKIIPKLKNYLSDSGRQDESPIIIVTCSAKQKMCTYYLPLSGKDKFFMGRPTAEEYSKQFSSMRLSESFGIDLGAVFVGIKKVFGMGPRKKAKKASNKNEL